MRGSRVGTTVLLASFFCGTSCHEARVHEPEAIAPPRAAHGDPDELIARWRSILAAAKSGDAAAVRKQVSTFALSSDEIGALLRDDASPFLCMQLDMCSMSLRWFVGAEAFRVLAALEGEVAIRATGETAVTLSEFPNWEPVHGPLELSTVFRRAPELYAVELRTSEGDVTPLFSGFFWTGERWRLLNLDPEWPHRLASVERSVAQEIRRLCEHVQLYRETRVELPKDLAELVRAGYATRAEITDPWRRPYELSAAPRTKAGFVVLSRGSDLEDRYDDVHSDRLVY